MIAVICAMPEELEEFEKILLNCKKEIINNYEFIKGFLGDKEVILSRCFVGKTNAAILTTILIINYHPGLIINTGCAGSTNKDVKVLDVVVSSVIAHHDIYIPEEVMTLDWHRNYNNHNLSFKADERAINIIDKLKTDINIHIGGIVSGDMFVCQKDEADKILSFYPNCLCAEMEGASVAQTCAKLDTNFVIIRSISDDTLVNEGYKKYNFNLEIALKNSTYITKELIERY